MLHWLYLCMASFTEVALVNKDSWEIVHRTSMLAKFADTNIVVREVMHECRGSNNYWSRNQQSRVQLVDSWGF